MIYQLTSDYFLRPLTENDINGPYPTWFEDQEISRYNSHGKFFKTRGYFEAYLRDLDKEDRIVMAICHNVDGHIGNVSLQEISFINRTAEFAIIIGNNQHFGKGVARLAGRAVLSHGFSKLDLERIHCGTASTNSRMQRLALALGMSLEGTRRQHLFLDGCRVDMLEYGILRPEFKQSQP